MAPATLALAAVLDMVVGRVASRPLDLTNPWDASTTMQVEHRPAAVLERTDPWTGELIAVKPAMSFELDRRVY